MIIDFQSYRRGINAPTAVRLVAAAEIQTFRSYRRGMCVNEFTGTKQQWFDQARNGFAAKASGTR